MNSGDNPFRKAQRRLRDGTRAASRALEESGVVENIAKAGEKGYRLASQKYQEYEVEQVVRPTVQSLKKTYVGISEKISEADESLGISRNVKSVAHSLDQDVVKSAKQYMNDTGISDATHAFARRTGDGYGAARGLIKPFFAPESARELLANTQRELSAITACILQVNHREAEDFLGHIGQMVSAKVAGAAGTLTLFGLVSTFGTAGTGSAIAGLTGAAANSATLAAIGGTVGGGMAAGALVLSGFGVLVGIGAYKLMSSTARDYNSLPEEDRRIVDTAGVLSAAVRERLDQEDVELSADEAIRFLQSVEPFQRHLEDNQGEICSRLDVKNSVAFRQHVVPDFKLVVVRDFRNYVNLASATIDGLIGGVFYALLSESVRPSVYE